MINFNIPCREFNNLKELKRITNLKEIVLKDFDCIFIFTN